MIYVIYKTLKINAFLRSDAFLLDFCNQDTVWFKTELKAGRAF